MPAAVKGRTHILIAALGLALATPGVPFAMSAQSANLPFRVVPLQVLANQRGGFVGAEGMRLQLNMNLRQMVYVNKVLVSDIRVNLPDIASAVGENMDSLRAQMQAQREQIRAEAEAVARGVGATTGHASDSPGGVGSLSGNQHGSTGTRSDPGSGLQTGLGTSSSQSSSQSTGTSQGVSSAPTVTTLSGSSSGGGDAPGQLVLVQNGGGNHVDPRMLQDIRGGALTIIQNSLNNQAIQHVMTVDVTLSGLRNLRTMELLGGLNLQLRGSGR